MVRCRKWWDTRRGGLARTHTRHWARHHVCDDKNTDSGSERWRSVAAVVVAVTVNCYLMEAAAATVNDCLVVVVVVVAKEIAAVNLVVVTKVEVIITN